MTVAVLIFCNAVLATAAVIDRTGLNATSPNLSIVSGVLGAEGSQFIVDLCNETALGDPTCDRATTDLTVIIDGTAFPNRSSLIISSYGTPVEGGGAACPYRSLSIELRQLVFQGSNAIALQGGAFCNATVLLTEAANGSAPVDVVLSNVSLQLKSNVSVRNTRLGTLLVAGDRFAINESSVMELRNVTFERTTPQDRGSLVYQRLLGSGNNIAAQVDEDGGSGGMLLSLAARVFVERASVFQVAESSLPHGIWFYSAMVLLAGGSSMVVSNCTIGLPMTLPSVTPTSLYRGIAFDLTQPAASYGDLVGTDGGGLFVWDNSTLTLDDCTVYATEGSGLLFNFSKTVSRHLEIERSSAIVLRGSNVTSNTDAIRIDFSSAVMGDVGIQASSTFLIVNCTVETSSNVNGSGILFDFEAADSSGVLVVDGSSILVADCRVDVGWSNRPMNTTPAGGAGTATNIETTTAPAAWSIRMHRGLNVAVVVQDHASIEWSNSIVASWVEDGSMEYGVGVLIALARSVGGALRVRNQSSIAAARGSIIAGRRNAFEIDFAASSLFAMTVSDHSRIAIDGNGTSVWGVTRYGFALSGAACVGCSITIGEASYVGLSNAFLAHGGTDAIHFNCSATSLLMLIITGGSYLGASGGASMLSDTRAAILFGLDGSASANVFVSRGSWVGAAGQCKVVGGRYGFLAIFDSAIELHLTLTRGGTLGVANGTVVTIVVGQSSAGGSPPSTAVSISLRYVVQAEISLSEGSLMGAQTGSTVQGIAFSLEHAEASTLSLSEGSTVGVTSEAAVTALSPLDAVVVTFFNATKLSVQLASGATLGVAGGSAITSNGPLRGLFVTFASTQNCAVLVNGSSSSSLEGAAGGAAAVIGARDGSRITTFGGVGFEFTLASSVGLTMSLIAGAVLGVANATSITVATNDALALYLGSSHSLALTAEDGSVIGATDGSALTSSVSEVINVTLSHSTGLRLTLSQRSFLGIVRSSTATGSASLLYVELGYVTDAQIALHDASTLGAAATDMMLSSGMLCYLYSNSGSGVLLLLTGGSTIGLSDEATALGGTSYGVAMFMMRGSDIRVELWNRSVIGVRDGSTLSSKDCAVYLGIGTSSKVSIVVATGSAFGGVNRSTIAATELHVVQMEFTTSADVHIAVAGIGSVIGVRDECNVTGTPSYAATRVRIDGCVNASLTVQQGGLVGLDGRIHVINASGTLVDVNDKATTGDGSVSILVTTGGCIGVRGASVLRGWIARGFGFKADASMVTRGGAMHFLNLTISDGGFVGLDANVAMQTEPIEKSGRAVDFEFVGRIQSSVPANAPPAIWILRVVGASSGMGIRDALTADTGSTRQHYGVNIAMSFVARMSVAVTDGAFIGINQQAATAHQDRKTLRFSTRGVLFYVMSAIEFDMRISNDAFVGIKRCALDLVGSQFAEALGVSLYLYGLSNSTVFLEDGGAFGMLDRSNQTVLFGMPVFAGYAYGQNVAYVVRNGSRVGVLDGSNATSLGDRSGAMQLIFSHSIDVSVVLSDGALVGVDGNSTLDGSTNGFLLNCVSTTHLSILVEEASILGVAGRHASVHGARLNGMVAMLSGISLLSLTVRRRAVLGITGGTTCAGGSYGLTINATGNSDGFISVEDGSLIGIGNHSQSVGFYGFLFLASSTSYFIVAVQDHSTIGVRGEGSSSHGSETVDGSGIYFFMSSTENMVFAVTGGSTVGIMDGCATTSMAWSFGRSTDLRVLVANGSRVGVAGTATPSTVIPVPALHVSFQDVVVASVEIVNRSIVGAWGGALMGGAASAMHVALERARVLTILVSMDSAVGFAECAMTSHNGSFRLYATLSEGVTIALDTRSFIGDTKSERNDCAAATTGQQQQQMLAAQLSYILLTANHTTAFRIDMRTHSTIGWSGTQPASASYRAVGLNMEHSTDATLSVASGSFIGIEGDAVSLTGWVGQSSGVGVFFSNASSPTLVVDGAGSMIGVRGIGGSGGMRLINLGPAPVVVVSFHMSNASTFAITGGAVVGMVGPEVTISSLSVFAMLLDFSKSSHSLLLVSDDGKAGIGDGANVSASLFIVFLVETTDSMDMSAVVSDGGFCGVWNGSTAITTLPESGGVPVSANGDLRQRPDTWGGLVWYCQRSKDLNITVQRQSAIGVANGSSVVGGIGCGVLITIISDDAQTVGAKVVLSHGSYIGVMGHSTASGGLRFVGGGVAKHRNDTNTTSDSNSRNTAVSLELLSGSALLFLDATAILAATTSGSASNTTSNVTVANNTNTTTTSAPLPAPQRAVISVENIALHCEGTTALSEAAVGGSAPCIVVASTNFVVANNSEPDTLRVIDLRNVTLNSSSSGNVSTTAVAEVRCNERDGQQLSSLWYRTVPEGGDKIAGSAGVRSARVPLNETIVNNSACPDTASITRISPTASVSRLADTASSSLSLSREVTRSHDTPSPSAAASPNVSASTSVSAVPSPSSTRSHSMNESDTAEATPTTEVSQTRLTPSSTASLSVDAASATGTRSPSITPRTASLTSSLPVPEVEVHSESAAEVVLKQSAGVSTLVSSLTMPSGALSARRVSLLATLGDCDANDLPSADEELREDVDFMDAPLRLELGAERGAWHRGAVVGDLIVCGVCCAGGLLLTLLVRHMDGKRRLASKSERGVTRDLVESAAKLRLPGMLFILVSLFLQQLVTSSVLLVSESSGAADGSDVAVGTVGLLVVAALTAAMGRVLDPRSGRFRAVAEDFEGRDDDDRLARAALGRTQGCQTVLGRVRTTWRRVTQEKVVWHARDDGGDDHLFVERYGFLFESCCRRRHWWLMVEVVATVVVGAVAGVVPRSYGACLAGASIAVAVCAVSLLLAVVLRPMNNDAEGVLVVLMWGAQLAIVVCGMAGAPRVVSYVLGIIASILSGILAVAMVAVVLKTRLTQYAHVRGAGRRRQHRSFTGRGDRALPPASTTEDEASMRSQCHAGDERRARGVEADDNEVEAHQAVRIAMATRKPAPGSARQCPPKLLELVSTICYNSKKRLANAEGVDVFPVADEEGNISHCVQPQRVAPLRVKFMRQ